MPKVAYLHFVKTLNTTLTCLHASHQYLAIVSWSYCYSADQLHTISPHTSLKPDVSALQNMLAYAHHLVMVINHLDSIDFSLSQWN